MSKSQNEPEIGKVLGIGASAGGLDAIQHLFDHIPADTGHSFVIIQHLSPDFKSLISNMHGKTAFQELRKMNPDIYIITQTAVAMNGEIEELSAMGFDEVISKPVDLDNLKERINAE